MWPAALAWSQAASYSTNRHTHRQTWTAVLACSQAAQNKYDAHSHAQTDLDSNLGVLTSSIQQTHAQTDLNSCLGMLTGSIPLLLAELQQLLQLLLHVAISVT